MAARVRRIVNITSSAGRALIDILGLSNGAWGWTGFVAGGAQQQTGFGQRHHQQLLPGASTPTGPRPRWRARPENGPADRDRMAARRKTILQRFGTPDEFGAACAFLCSRKPATSRARTSDRRGAYPARTEGAPVLSPERSGEGWRCDDGGGPRGGKACSFAGAR
jgi:NAD(P)-dependent dehydrogenase (short-subunit alcohol dehydrogenase family)